MFDAAWAKGASINDVRTLGGEGGSRKVDESTVAPACKVSVLSAEN